MFMALSALTLISCSRESPILPDITADYFPLQIGNNWTLRNSLDSTLVLYEITDTLILNEHVYFVQVRTFSDGTKDTNYFRKTEKNIVLIYYEGCDYIFIDFEKPINDTWNSYKDLYGYIKQRDISLLVEAGKFDNVIEVYTGSKHIPDLFEFNRYAPGIGFS
jgi:hypothetical protein